MGSGGDGNGFDNAVRDALGIDFEGDSEELMFQQLDDDETENTGFDEYLEESTPRKINSLKKNSLEKNSLEKNSLTKNNIGKKSSYDENFLNLARKPSVNDSSLILPTNNISSISIVFGEDSMSRSGKIEQNNNKTNNNKKSLNNNSFNNNSFNNNS